MRRNALGLEFRRAERFAWIPTMKLKGFFLQRALQTFIHHGSGRA